MKRPRLSSFVFFAYLLAVCFVVVRNFFSPWGDMFHNLGFYSHYNNYLIFRQSFGHLLEGLNLYITYPNEYFDLYKYPPFFAMLMAPFFGMPVWLGYGIWTALNVFLPLYALSRLGALTTNKGLILALLILPESITSALNSQSNGLVIGLLLLSMDAATSKNTFLAVLYIWLSAFIKIFGGLFFLIFLCFPKQLFSALKYGALIFALFLLLPVFFGGLNVLHRHYLDWFELLKNDFGFHVKYSVMGWLKSWFGLSFSKNSILLFGLMIQIIPLIVNWKRRTERLFYHPFLISILVWMVIFNHMAESATFVIAVVPIGLWFALRDKILTVEWVMGVLLLLFTILGPSDIYPPTARKLIVETYQLKVFPCILFWLYMIYHSFFLMRFDAKVSK